MTTVSMILKRKGYQVSTVDPTARIADVAIGIPAGLGSFWDGPMGRRPVTFPTFSGR